VDLGLANLGLLDLNLKVEDKMLLAQAIRGRGGMSGIVKDIFKRYAGPRELKYRFDTMARRWISYERSWKRRIDFGFFDILIHFPRVLGLLFRTERAFKGMKSARQNVGRSS
jgi:hypothetical protein